MKINPYLVARFMAVQEAFLQPGLRPAMAMANPGTVAPKKGSWKDLLSGDGDDEDEEGGGGGGTQRGHRGKNSEYAKAVAKVRRLGR